MRGPRTWGEARFWVFASPQRYSDSRHPRANGGGHASALGGGSARIACAALGTADPAHGVGTTGVGTLGGVPSARPASRRPIRSTPLTPLFRRPSQDFA